MSRENAHQSSLRVVGLLTFEISSPKIYVPTLNEIATGLVYAGLAQIPLTLTNAVVARAALLSNYFPKREVKPSSLILNMGIIATFAAYFLYRGVISLLGESRRSLLVAGFIAAWGSVFLAAIACAIELALSGASPMGVVLPAMAGVHALIGIGEGLITGTVLSLVLATRADLLQLQRI